MIKKINMLYKENEKNLAKLKNVNKNQEVIDNNGKDLEHEES